MKPIEKDALHILMNSSWFVPLVALAEIIVFAIGLIIGVRMGR